MKGKYDYAKDAAAKVFLGTRKKIGKEAVTIDPKRSRKEKTMSPKNRQKHDLEHH